MAADAAEAHGPDGTITLSARFEVAVWTRETAGPEAGARRFAALLDHIGPLPSAWPGLAADCRWNLGGALLASGDTHRAAEVLATAVADAEHAYGPHQARTFDIRASRIEAVSAAGDVPAAKAMAAVLAEECARRLGADHLTTRNVVTLAQQWS